MFKDSLQFRASSVDTLASNLLRSGKNLFKQIGAFLQIEGAPHLHCDMLFGKGVNPYEHVDS